uniref:PHD-type zinc finger plants domain-containing protein n=1 Tax=Oryza brachyantha TaxID=4533 RepID=J3LFG9_ORYBR
MCGDVGFPDKLFRCARCRRRFQHSYCTNYYGDGAPAEAGAGVCDWCLSDPAVVVGKKGAPATTTPGGGCRQTTEGNDEPFSREYRAKNKPATGGGEQEGGGRRVSKAAVRRYKLLKDVLC